ncbi:14414_t:CDS:2, partial [Dentiscutata heterogama]
MHKCDRCSKSFEQTAFISKTGKPTKICYECRQKNLNTYYATKPNENIGNNKYVENENSGIDFSCKISTVLLKSEPHELGKKIAEILSVHESMKISINSVIEDILNDFPVMHPDRFNTSDDIKAEIKKNIHLAPADIFKQLEQQNPNLTQKQQQGVYSFVFLQSQHILQQFSTQLIQSNTVDNITDINSNDDDNTESSQIFEEYKSLLRNALEIAQSVQGSFKGVQNLVMDIKSYKRRITNPRTWKDHNRHTMFLNLQD